MESRLEKLLTALLNGEQIDFTPRSRAEAYLKACCEKCGCEGLPEPKSRADALYYALAEQMANGGGGSGKPEQSKIIKFLENGEFDILPNTGYTLSKVTVKVNVPTDSGGGLLTASTDAEMTALLIDENVNSVVEFTGTSTIYETGRLYLIQGE